MIPIMAKDTLSQRRITIEIVGFFILAVLCGCGFGGLL